jgi:hypothetical protein
MTATKVTALGVVLIAFALAQSAPPKFIVGTVSGFKAETAEMEVKPDQGDTVSLKVTAATQALRVPPGEKDLKKAEPIQVTDVAAGDRVLVNLMPAAFEARRIVVMSSSDIGKRNAADSADWTRRGIAGIVAAKNGNEITLRKRSFQGEIKLTVTVNDKTSYKRYAPDSVKFADAKISGLADISVGDQLRARGQKSDDGLKVGADEIVFGTFLTKAGPITAVNVEAKEITISDLTTHQPLVIKLTGDSQLKRMPDFAGMPGGGAPGGGPPGGAMMHAPGGMAGGPPDMAQMLEHMPPAKMEDLKAGDTIIVSSTKGASSGQVTAIMLVANAGMLVRMATMQSGGGGAAAAAAGARGGAGMGGGMGGMGMGGMGGGGFGGLELPGMSP